MWIKTIIGSLLMSMMPGGFAAPLGENAFETISISSKEAREDEQPGILHFKGDFQMRSSDWQLISDRATVYGSPNKPDRVLLEGSPAHFLVKRSVDTGEEPVEATASVVEYVRSTNKLKLSGNATLMLGDEVIRSSTIEYDIETERYSAGGADGVLIEVPPKD